MSKTISKTDYILYRECPKDAWYKVHKPDDYFAKELSEFAQALIETGNEVELVARQLFPDGVLVEDRYDVGREQTQELLGNHTPVIFQAVFSKDGFMAALDVLEYVSSSNSYIVTEIK